MAIKPQGIAGLNVGDTNTLLNQMGKPKSLGDLAELYKQGILGQGPLKSKFVPPVGRFKTAPGQSTGMGYLKDIANFGLSGVDLFNQGIGAISAVTNPSGNLIGDYLSQEDPDSFEKRKFNVTGPEVFLPDENRNIYGAFSPEGQKRLFGQGELAEEENAIAGESDTGSDELQKRLSKIAESTDVSEEEKGIAGELTSKDVGGTGEAIEGADTDAKKATVSALNDFLKGARPGVNPKTFDEYINEFGEATGLDISGEADTKQALMSFGLALMQNRAGKGFDVSKILTATGEAGEAAMPDFRKATAEAKSVRAKAGAYALSKKESDQKKAMNRKAYFVIPKGDGSASSLSNMIVGGKGRLTRLNSYELNNLDSNSKFNEQFEIVDAEYYKDYAKAALTASGKNKFYQSKSVDVPLFREAPKGLSFKAQLADGNFAPAGTSPLFIDSSKRVVGMIQSMERKVDYNAKEFEKLAGLLNQTDITVLDQGRSIIKQTLRNFGLNIGDTDPVKQIKTIMQRLQATNAAEILQESGKTLSDADRKFVREIVGDVNFLEGDEAVLRGKLSNLFNVIVKRGRENIKDSYDNLAAYGVNIDNKNITAQNTTMIKGEDNVFRFKVQGTT
tara:strand:+ start:395 stop:2248 length:1854 start_codon:yes stop_codon:yes gene_type:complete